MKNNVINYVLCKNSSESFKYLSGDNKYGSLISQAKQFNLNSALSMLGCLSDPHIILKLTTNVTVVDIVIDGESLYNSKIATTRGKN